MTTLAVGTGVVDGAEVGAGVVDGVGVVVNGKNEGSWNGVGVGVGGSVGAVVG